MDVKQWYEENIKLSKILTSTKNPSGKFSLKGKEVSYEALHDVFQHNMQELTHTDGKFDWYKYDANKNTLFRLMSETLTEVQPKKVMDMYSQFANVRTVPQGDTIVFTRKIGQERAKQFVTRVGLAGRYEVFELAEEKYTMKTTAYGAAARIPLEEFLDGRVQWSDYLDIVNEGMSEVVYKEIAAALRTAVANFPTANKVSVSSFDEATFDHLLQTIAIYGTPTIYCTLEAAMTLVPSNATYWSDAMKNEKWSNGYFTRYKGFPVVILPQSFTDTTNTTKVIHPADIYVFPGGMAKPIDIVFEGSTLVKDFDNRDWSSEIQTYQKFGVAVQTTNNLGVFHNNGLSISNSFSGTWAWSPSWS